MKQTFFGIYEATLGLSVTTGTFFQNTMLYRHYGTVVECVYLQHIDKFIYRLNFKITWHHYLFRALGCKLKYYSGSITNN